MKTKFEQQKKSVLVTIFLFLHEIIVFFYQEIFRKGHNFLWEKSNIILLNLKDCVSFKIFFRWTEKIIKNGDLFGYF
jgi:hypothetical protein